jgi:hypothetical protein
MNITLTGDEKNLVKFLYSNYYSRKPALIYGLEATGKLEAIKLFCKLKKIADEDIITVRLT